MSETPTLDLVAFDSGIYHAGLFKVGLTAEQNLCPLVLEFARRQAYRVLVLNTVTDELFAWARARGELREIEDRLLGFLGQCDAEWPPPLSAATLGAHEQRFHAMLRHRADAAVAVEALMHRPHYLVQCNPRHWNRLPPGALGRCRVVSPRDFLGTLDLPDIPEPRARARRPR